MSLKVLTSRSSFSQGVEEMPFFSRGDTGLLTLPPATPPETTKRLLNAGFPTSAASAALTTTTSPTGVADGWTALSALDPSLKHDYPDEDEYFIQSSNGSVYIDVGGVTHRVCIANFRLDCDV